MVTVVSQGGEPPKRITCRDCYTELSYFNRDVKSGWLLCKYIECPACQSEVVIYYPPRF